MRSETLAETFLTKKAVLHGASWHFYLFMRWGPWESRIDLSVKYKKTLGISDDSCVYVEYILRQLNLSL